MVYIHLVNVVMFWMNVLAYWKQYWILMCNLYCTHIDCIFILHLNFVIGYLMNGL